MTVFPNSVRLTDTRNLVLADYPASRIIFCSASSDSDRRFFGLVTSAYHEVDDEGDDTIGMGNCVPSSSCHVFNIDPKIHSHVDHLARAETFKLNCSGSQAIGECSNFPKTSDPILRAIKNLYIDGDFEASPEQPPHQVNSPHPSNASSTNSSNSDSGIGFRDECGNQSDRILVVDIQNQRLHIQQVGHNDSLASSLALPLPTPKQDNSGSNQHLTLRAMPDPIATASRPTGDQSCSPISDSSSERHRCHSEAVDTHFYYPNPIPRFLYQSEEQDQCFSFNQKSCSDFYHSNPPSGNYSMVSMAPSQDDVCVISLKSQDLSVFPFDSKDWRRCNASSQKSGFGSYISVENMSMASTWKSLEDTNMDVAESAKAHSVADFTSLTSYNEDMSVGSCRSHEALLNYKLSPKVFGVPRPAATHSLEDLTMTETPSETPLSGRGRGQQWGSLQELRTFGMPDFQHAPPPTPKMVSPIFFTDHSLNYEVCVSCALCSPS